MSQIGIKTNVELSIENKTIHASPTSNYIDKLAREITATPGSLYPLTRIVLVDNAGAERDTITVSSTDWSVSSTSMTVTKDFTASASYTCTKIRLYTVTGEMYFEGTISAISITANLSYRVTATISISINASITVTPGVTVQSVGTTTLAQNIINKLAGRSSNSITINRIRYLGADATSTRLEQQTTNSISPPTIYHPTTNFTNSGTWQYIALVSTDATAVVVIAFSSYVSVTTSDTVNLQITFNLT